MTRLNSIARIGAGVTAAALVAGLVTTAQAASFRAFLDSAQEVPPAGSTNASLTATAELELIGTGADAALSMSIMFPDGFDFGPISGDGSTPEETDNEVVGLHIHNAARGQAGPVVFGLLAPNSDTDGDLDLMENDDGTTTVSSEWDVGEGNGGADLSDFLAELLATAPGADTALYLNLHTGADPQGAIRGQITSVVPLPAALPMFVAAIAGLLGVRHLSRKLRGGRPRVEMA